MGTFVDGSKDVKWSNILEFYREDGGYVSHCLEILKIEVVDNILLWSRLSMFEALKWTEFVVQYVDCNAN